MKAMILAGGKGMRVRPITETLPKPMIPIINRPLMEFLIDLLKRHRFDQIVVSTAYLADMIESYFRDGSRFGVKIGYSFEGYHEEGRCVPEGLGSAGGIRKVQEFSGFFDDTFAVLCGDGIIDVDLTAALKFHRSRKALATIVLKDVPREQVGAYGVVQTSADGRITQFQEKPQPHEALSTTINTGIYLFEPEVIDYIPAKTVFDIGRDLFPALVAQRLPFYGVSLPFNWIDISRTTDYWEATQRILRGEFKVDFAGRKLAPGIWGGINLAVDFSKCNLRPPLYIGSSTSIEPGATVIGPTVLGRNCLIESGAIVDSCVVDDYTRVSGFADVHEKIISGRFCVDRHGQNIDLVSAGCAFVIDDVRERHHWSRDERVLMDFLASLQLPDGVAEFDAAPAPAPTAVPVPVVSGESPVLGLAPGKAALAT